MSDRLTQLFEQHAGLDYPALRVWHVSSGSLPYYVEGVVAQARRDRAPADAIYRNVDSHTSGKWRRVSDLPESHTFRIAYEATRGIKARAR